MVCRLGWRTVNKFGSGSDSDPRLPDLPFPTPRTYCTCRVSLYLIRSLSLACFDCVHLTTMEGNRDRLIVYTDELGGGRYEIYI